MAFDGTPTAWIAGWSENGTNITVPIASFPELTAAEADGTTGDIRKIAWAIVEKLFQEFNGRASADRPAKFTITKSASLNSANGELTNQFVVTFRNEIATQEVVNE